MTKDQITALCIAGGLGLLIIVFAILMLSGKGAFLVAGYNTLSKEAREKYDVQGICKFVGKILLPIGILTVLLSGGEVFGIMWIGKIYAYAVIVLLVFAVVYANTGNRFRKK